MSDSAPETLVVETDLSRFQKHASKANWFSVWYVAIAKRREAARADINALIQETDRLVAAGTIPAAVPKL